MFGFRHLSLTVIVLIATAVVAILLGLFFLSFLVAPRVFPG
jgi:antibiotic biosynthesis monooxygenase (ABM) superfamily enzyme